MSDTLSPVSSCCCPCHEDGASAQGVLGQRAGRRFGDLFDALLRDAPASPLSRSGGVGMGVGDWFGSLSPISNAWLAQLLSELKASGALEDRMRGGTDVPVARPAPADRPPMDPKRGAPNRFIDEVAPRAARPATPATPAPSHVDAPATPTSTPHEPRVRPVPHLRMHGTLGAVGRGSS